MFIMCLCTYPTRQHLFSPHPSFTPTHPHQHSLSPYPSFTPTHPHAHTPTTPSHNFQLPLQIYSTPLTILALFLHTYVCTCVSTLTHTHKYTYNCTSTHNTHYFGTVPRWYSANSFSCRSLRETRCSTEGGRGTLC